MSNKKETFILPDNPILANKLNRLSKTVEEAEKPFIVNLTLSPNFSGGNPYGTMDKTMSELLAAYNAGKRILFSLTIDGLGTEEFTCTEIANDGTCEYPTFNSVFITANLLTQSRPALVWFFTTMSNDPDDNAWDACIFYLDSLTV